MAGRVRRTIFFMLGISSALVVQRHLGEGLRVSSSPLLGISGASPTLVAPSPISSSYESSLMLDDSALRYRFSPILLTRSLLGPLRWEQKASISLQQLWLIGRLGTFGLAMPYQVQS